MRFTKMHGIGNDFIIIDAINQDLEWSDLMTKWCDRHYGIGADGVILALPSRVADARMRIFNADGGEPEMCGNGIRCLGRFLWDKELVRKNPMTVETLAGVLTLWLDVADGEVRAVTVDMGRPRFAPEDIPVSSPDNFITADLDGQAVRFCCVSMGNPHAVTFDCYPEDEAFYRFGPRMEHDPRLPRRANVEFCRLRADGGIDVRVWERGDGETLACGTGACAVVAAAASQGLSPRETDVHLPGGVLHIRWADDGPITMTGPAERVFEGEM